jgi:hypothetical protein
MKYIFVLIFLVMINSGSFADTGIVYHGNIKRLPADTDTIYRKRSITLGAVRALSNILLLAPMLYIILSRGFSFMVPK